jgi:hypothetical protein
MEKDKKIFTVDNLYRAGLLLWGASLAYKYQDPANRPWVRARLRPVFDYEAQHLFTLGQSPSRRI